MRDLFRLLARFVPIAVMDAWLKKGVSLTRQKPPVTMCTVPPAPSDATSSADASTERHSASPPATTSTLDSKSTFDSRTG